jgi:hypothetical protein
LIFAGIRMMSGRFQDAIPAMLTVSKPLSSGQAQSYHKLEFTSETQNYYKQGDAVKGEWQGKLAASLGSRARCRPLEVLAARGREESADRGADGQAPRRMEYKNADGTTTKAVEHRAGWDATFSAPKSVSLTALVGGDDRVREAHRAAVTPLWTSWSGIPRRGSAATIPPRPRASSSPRSSSTTRRAR